MTLERLSLRTLITGLLVVVVLFSVMHTIVAKRQFRDAAVDFRVKSLARVVEVASEEVMRQARAHAATFGHTLQQRLPALDDPALVDQLNEPFIKGFVGAGRLDLQKLRVYDTDFRFIAASSAGDDGLPQALPVVLAAEATRRQGVDRFKALGGLWPSPHGPLYSVVIPIGGLSLRGYLEVVFDPLHNLRDVTGMISMPFGIHGLDGEELLHPEAISESDPDYAPVEYLLRYSDGTPALELAGYEKVDNLYGAMHRTQMVTTIIFLVLTVGLLLLVLWLLNRYLFRPVHTMINNMEHSLHDGHATPIDNHAIKEIHIAADAFNTMTRKVADNIHELQRLSALDGLTGIANRRHFDNTLAEEWPRAARTGASISLILIDIDFFKQYNDHYGHQAGDQCLKDIACCLNLAALRPGDLVARYGGEEFVVLLPNTDTFGAGVVALKLKQRVGQLQLPHAGSNVADTVTLSLGVCTLTPDPTQSSALLLSAADAALYRAKNGGRDRIEIAQAS